MISPPHFVCLTALFVHVALPISLRDDNNILVPICVSAAAAVGSLSRVDFLE